LKKFGTVHLGVVHLRKRRATFVCVLGSVVMAGTLRADTFDVLTKLKDTSASTVWRIDEPNVKQASTNYPQITFLPGDTVSVDAGGCVQTGGMGKTWKLYVNPSGPNSDHLYHGLIWVPGVDTRLTRLQAFGLNRTYQVPDPLPAGTNASQMYLRLGYEDDGYGDNGYYAHDDGDNNQCQNVDHAWLIISIGHDGAMPLNAGQFVGITPGNFRCQAAWSFQNFNTSELSWSTFTNAFSFGILDYLDPTTYITYLIGRYTLAFGGNCAGMSLLATVGEDQFVVGDLRESFWSNYRSQPAVATDINTSHWKQWSAFFMRNWIETVVNSPSTNATTIERDLTRADYNYGLLTLQNGLEGHVMVPLSVSHAGSQTLISVYDPNRPCAGIPDTGSYPSVVISGNNWSYQMAGGQTWSGSGGGLGYVPYLGEDGWSDYGMSLTGVVKIVFGNGVNVEQVTDSTGRRLFVPNQAGVVDRSAQGLGGSLFQVPKYGDTAPKRPRTSGSVFTLAHPINLPPAVVSQGAAMQSEYEADYGASGQVFLATNAQLNDLNFTLSGTKAGQSVRVMVGKPGEFFEMKMAAGAATAPHPSVVIHSLGNFAAGATVQDRNGAALNVTFSHGLVSAAQKTITIQQTDEIAASTVPMKFQLTSTNDVQVLANGAPSQTKVNTHTIDSLGAITTAPVRQLMIQKPN
jgi:hypothetical protein